jgi:F0F1-type ATP synthase assembly protein I
MYTDEDLDFAMKKGVFSKQSVEEFRLILSEQKNSPSVDEEYFRLITGFNDVFVVIACMLLLFSSLLVFESIFDDLVVGVIVLTLLSWLLSEFFVLRRKMALPAIALLLSFIGGFFVIVLSFFSTPFGMEAMITAAVLSAIAAYFHWLRFGVPITVAVGAATVVGVVVSITTSNFPNTNSWLLVILFVCGLLAFVIAMYWDAADTERTTRRSDVAFWLHLLSAPLIIHPVFSSMGVLEGNESIGNMSIVVLLYIFMTLISIVIDRRAFMVSSLIYVLTAITNLINTYGDVGYSFALTGVFMGGMLLLLSVFWHRTRRYLVIKLPNQMKGYIPKVQAV